MSGVNLPTVTSVNPTTDGDAANQPRLFAGKYKTVEEMERGYLSSQTEAGRIIAERNELAKKATILETLVRGAGNDRMMPADRVAARSSMDTLAESLSVDRATLEGALGEVVGRQLAPITGVLAAQQRVNADIPDFGKFQPEIAQFLQANPEVSSEYETMIRNPDTAAAGMRYAYLMYKATAPAAASQSTTTQQVDASGAAQAAARLDAMIPGGTGSGRAAALSAADGAEREALLTHGRKTGDWSGYLAWALGDSSQRTV